MENAQNNYVQILPSVYSTKDYVACKPLAVKTQVQTTSIASLMNKIDNLEALEVLFGTEDNVYQFGDKLYLKPESYDNNDLKKTYHINGMAFILVPRSLIIASTRAPKIDYPWTLGGQWQIQQQPITPNWPHPGYPVPHDTSTTIWWTVTGSTSGEKK